MRSLLLSLLALAASIPAASGPIPLSKFDLGPANGHQSAPSIAAGEHGFLAAWIDARDTFEGDLRATRLDDTGTALDPTGILILEDEWHDQTSISTPSIFWNGEEWLLVFSRGSSLMTARLSDEGTITQSPRAIASGVESPTYGLTAFKVGDRIVVAGLAIRGASMAVIDELGGLVTAPRIIEATTSSRSISSVVAAPIEGDVLVIDLSAYACPGCTEAIAHRVRLDGSVVERVAVPAIDVASMTFAIAPHDEGFVLVEQRFDAAVGSWLLSPSGTTVLSHQIVSSVTSYSYNGWSLDLQSRTGGPELLYFAPAAQNGSPVLHRASFGAGGAITSAPFPLPGTDAGQISVAASASATMAVSTYYASDFTTDVVVRVAPSLDALPQGTSRDITYSAPVQTEARTVRRGNETLVTWSEFRRGLPRLLLATLVDETGRPRSADPVSLLIGEAEYSIATDGIEYLVAKQAGSEIRVRHLRSDLAWREPDWITLVRGACGTLNARSLVWDGDGWWLAWNSCEPGWKPTLQRFSRNLEPLTKTIEIDTDESDPPGTPLLAAIDGSIIAFWNGAPPPCNICTCVASPVKLYGARISLGGLILKQPTLIVDGVDGDFTSFAWNGLELLAIWSGSGYPTATRISPDLVALDVTREDGWGPYGVVLEENSYYEVSIGWDGEQWVTVARSHDWRSPSANRFVFRRFPTGIDLSALWKGAAARDLGKTIEGTATAISAAAGGATLLVQPFATAETTGVYRYYIRNMSDEPRTRGVRR